MCVLCSGLDEYRRENDVQYPQGDCRDDRDDDIVIDVVVGDA